MSKLIMFEGIPGSGKTTSATNTKKYLLEHKKSCHCFLEGELHPADMAWCACLTEQELEQVLIKYPAYKDAIYANMTRYEDYYIIAYTRFDIDGKDSSLGEYFESKEVYDGRCDNELYQKLHINRWKQFGEKAKKEADISIFECVFLQNHVNELLLFRNADELEILDFLNQLALSVKDLDPILFYYAHDNIETIINHVSSQRVDENGHEVWGERVAEYVSESPYGKLHHLEGREGMVEYFRIRQELELRLLKQLPIQSHIITAYGLDYVNAFEDAIHVIDSAM